MAQTPYNDVVFVRRGSSTGSGQLSTPDGLLINTSQWPAARMLQSMERSYNLWRSGGPALATADTPTVFGQILLGNNPTNDPTTGDRTTNLVVLNGGTAFATSADLYVSPTQKANAFKWISGYNRGARFCWNYTGYRGGNVAGGLLGDSSNANVGNNYSATSNPTGAVWPLNLTTAYFDAMVDDTYFAFPVSSASLFQVYINDALVNVAPTTGANYSTLTYNASLANTNCYQAVSGGNGWVKVTWSTRAKRNVRVVIINAQMGPGDFYISATGNALPRYPSKPTYLIIGDSFCAGATPLPVQTAMGNSIANLVGPEFDVVNAAQGGTGFNSGVSPFYSRWNTDLAVVQTPSIISIIAGQNDTATDIANYAPAFLAQARANWPLAPIFVSLNYGPSSYSTAAAREAALQAACATVQNCVYIPTFTATGSSPVSGQSFLYGTGSVTTPSGSGNADVYVGGNGGDAIHPSPAGGFAWAEHHIRGVIANLMNASSF